jgi:hypothetical protein
MLKLIAEILAGIVSYFSNRQLLEAGKAMEKANVYEAEHKAAEEVDAIIKDIDSLPLNTVNERLSKWERD